MSQISPPIRILAIAALALLAAWMLVLRPKSDAPAPAPAPAVKTAPGVKGLTRAVGSAKGARAAEESRDAKVQKATGGDATGSAAGTATATGAASGASTPADAVKAAGVKPGDLPMPVLKAIAGHKVMVLLFWNPRSADDRAVKRAVDKADRWGGEVFVRSAPLGTISRYGRITRGVDVEQSPTVVVVDRKLKAERLVGFVDKRTIDQAVVDALRNSGVMLEDRYLRAVNSICAQGGSMARTIVQPDSPVQMPSYVKHTRSVLSRVSARFAALKAPARFRSFKRATMADHRAYTSLMTDWVAYLGARPSAARVASSLGRFGGREKALVTRYDRRMDARHLLACGSNG